MNPAKTAPIPRVKKSTGRAQQIRVLRLANNEKNEKIGVNICL